MLENIIKILNLIMIIASTIGSIIWTIYRFKIKPRKDYEDAINSCSHPEVAMAIVRYIYVMETEYIDISTLMTLIGWDPNDKELRKEILKLIKEMKEVGILE